MALEPITRKEKIIAGENLEPITRLEKFLKNFGGGGGSGGGGGGVTTLHINVTAVNIETFEPTFTADKTPAEMRMAALNGPIWCVVTFEAGTIGEDALSIGIPPEWRGVNTVAFGSQTLPVHDQHGNNDVALVVSGTPVAGWTIDLSSLASN